MDHHDITFTGAPRTSQRKGGVFFSSSSKENFESDNQSRAFLAIKSLQSTSRQPQTTNKMKVFNVIVLAFVATVVASPAPEPMGEPGSVAELHKRQCSSCRNGQYSCVCGPGQWCWYKC
ncbi:hypothetical protein TWF569_007712 [Orbilia oligospora]|uniref:Uncharacterized protein n=1 Tax=Orbilia oligospora TaxID=2813651 RepID=A0A7C8NLS2_ORBOL|nr:hypothetical protein TWF102_007879 [Orbilia oligospora]KAF3137807.1 hypothetical protein TWF594_007456 [Orbilia oligospora]KAF3141940.1 hypothetical protein TWF569_007712 [Orbilia oligospora]